MAKTIIVTQRIPGPIAQILILSATKRNYTEHSVKQKANNTKSIIIICAQNALYLYT